MISDEVAAGNRYWIDFLTNVGEIDYRHALIIADFGIGSDSPLILYYDETEPCVMLLHWSGGATPVQHAWLRTHPSFATFAQAVGLIEWDQPPESTKTNHQFGWIQPNFSGIMKMS
jgi:hypothetical protein